MFKKFASSIIDNEKVSYLFFGVLTTIVSLVSYDIIKVLQTGGNEPTTLQMNIANICSWILAVIFAFITNKYIVFKSKTSTTKHFLKEIISFLGARIFSLAFEIIWMNVTVGFIIAFDIYIGFIISNAGNTIIEISNDTVCKILAQFGIVIMNYIFSRLFIFKNKEN